MAMKSPIEVNQMPVLLLISKHSPESCWLFNEDAKKVHLNLINKLEELLKKYGIRLLGCWFALSEHTMYEVYDVPNFEAFQKMSMEPEIAAWSSFNTMEIKLVSPLEDVMRILKQSL